MRALLISLTLLALAIPSAAQARPRKQTVVKKKAAPPKKVRKKSGRTVVIPMTITARRQVPVQITIPVKSRRYTRPDLELKREAFRSFRR